AWGVSDDRFEGRILERNVVVEVVELLLAAGRRSAGGCRRRRAHGPLARASAAIVAVAVHRLTPALPRPEHLHLAGDDVGGVALLAVLLVLAVLDPALDVDLRSLLQVFAGNLAEAPIQRDAMPLGLLLLLAVLVLPRLRGGHRDVGDRVAVRQVTRLRIA